MKPFADSLVDTRGKKHGALDEAARLIAALSAADQVEGRVEAEPQRCALRADAPLAAVELDSGQLPDDDAVVAGDALEVLVAQKRGVERERREVLGNEADRPDLREHRLLIGLGEGLAELEGAQVVEVRHPAPALSEECLALHAEGVAALFQPPAVCEFAAPVPDVKEHRVEVRVARRPSPQAGVRRKSPGGVQRAAERRVEAPVDRPVVGLPQDAPEARAVADRGCQESALAGHPLQGLAEVGYVEQWHASQAQHAVPHHRRPARHDIGARGAERPPRARRVAVRDPSVVDRVVLARLVGDARLKLEGIVGREQPRTALTGRGRAPAGFIEGAQFRLKVVRQPVGPEILLPVERPVVDVAGRGDLPAPLVKAQFVRGQDNVPVGQLHIARGPAQGPFAGLGVGADLDGGSEPGQLGGLRISWPPRPLAAPPPPAARGRARPGTRRTVGPNALCTCKLANRVTGRKVLPGDLRRAVSQAGLRGFEGAPNRDRTGQSGDRGIRHAPRVAQS